MTDYQKRSKYNLEQTLKALKSEKHKTIAVENNEFLQRNGFYPSASWLGRKVDVSREHVRTLFTNYPKLRSENNGLKGIDGTFRVVISSDMNEEIIKIQEKENITYKEALTSWNWNHSKEKKADK